MLQLHPHLQSTRAHRQQTTSHLYTFFFSVSYHTPVLQPFRASTHLHPYTHASPPPSPPTTPTLSPTSSLPPRPLLHKTAPHCQAKPHQHHHLPHTQPNNTQLNPPLLPHISPHPTAGAGSRAPSYVHCCPVAAGSAASVSACCRLTATSLNHHATAILARSAQVVR